MTEVEAERDRCFKLVRVAQDYITMRVSHQMLLEAIHHGWTSEGFVAEIEKRTALWRGEPKKAKKAPPPPPPPPPDLLQITIAPEKA